MEERTELDKLPPYIRYYLLEWKDRYMDEYIHYYGERKMRDLSLEELVDLFSHATAKDVEKLNTLINQKKVVILMTDDNKGLWSIYEESGQCVEFDFFSEKEATDFALDMGWVIVESFNIK